MNSAPARSITEPPEILGHLIGGALVGTFSGVLASYGVAGPLGHVVARSAKVPDAPLRWRLARGPWFDNNLATLEITEPGLRIWWATGDVEGDDHAHPRLRSVSEVTVP